MLGGEDPIQPITQAQFVKKNSSGLLLLHPSCFIFQFLEESNLYSFCFVFFLVFVYLAAQES